MHARSSNTTRIIANYVRLVSNFALGLILVRVLLQLGAEAFGLIALLTAGRGIAFAFREIIVTAIVPALGAAYHHADADRFRGTFSASMLVCCAATLVPIAFFSVMAVMLPWMSVPESLIDVSLAFLLAKGLETCVTVVLAPYFSMFVVSERMLAFNMWTTIERVGDALAAIVAVSLVGSDTSTGIVVYGVLSAAAFAAVQTVAVILLWRVDKRLRPSLRYLGWKDLKAFAHSASWNSVPNLVANLYSRLDIFIMNYVFGLMGTFIFGLANQVANYVRQLTMGIVVGLDAVSARLENSRDGDEVWLLLQRSTRLQGAVVFPGLLVLVFLADPLLQLWMGTRLDESPQAFTRVVVLIRILLIGTAARSLSECWTRVLSGVGHAKKHAIWSAMGAFCNPVLVFALLAVFPDSIRYTAPAVAFAILLTSVHLVALPIVTGRHFGKSYAEVVRPLQRPLMITILCAPIATLCTLDITQNAWPVLLALFGVVYGLGSVRFVLNRAERQHLVNLFMSRMSLKVGS